MLAAKYKIGEFDKRIQIIKKVITINDFNEEIESWELLKTKWAKEENNNLGIAGNEVIQGDKLTATRRTVYVIRYDSAIDEEMRIVFDDVVYDIVALKQPDGNRKRFLAIDCIFLEGEISPIGLGDFNDDFNEDFSI